jgi:hypothetical protein
MKKARAIMAVLILLLTIVFAYAIITCWGNRLVNDADMVKRIMQDIDNRVMWINELIDQKWYEDHYDGDTVIYRYFDKGVDEDESLTLYDLYYDERGKLIYADIAHYRDVHYSIYFHDNLLLHVELGHFQYAGGSFKGGDISNVQVIISEDPFYTFVLEDLAFCLSHAYK